MMKHLTARIAGLALLAASLSSPAFAQQQNTTKVVGTCGTATYTAGKMAYPTQDTTGAACTSGSGGGGGGVAGFTAEATATAVAAGTNKPASEDTANGAQRTELCKPGATTCVDPTAPSVIAGADGSTAASTSNPLPTQDLSTGASAATVPTKAGLHGCRAATAAPTVVTDGQLVDCLAGVEGKQIVLPYAIKELMVRGSTGAQTGTGAQAFTGISAPGGSLKFYQTGLQCSNTGASTSLVTLNDSATSSFINPAGGGQNVSFAVPLVYAANTAPTANFITASTSQYCSAQGYTGP